MSNDLLYKVPCRIVFETPDSSPKEGFLVLMPRCDLQLGEITRSQLEQLKLFMENYTTGV